MTCAICNKEVEQGETMVKSKDGDFMHSSCANQIGDLE